MDILLEMYFQQSKFTVVLNNQNLQYLLGNLLKKS